MNPFAAVAAVEALSREPVATLAAMAERMSQPHDGGTALLQQAPQSPLPSLAAALAEAAALQAAPPSPLDAAQAEALATAQAQHGRMTLGQMAMQAQDALQAQPATPGAATQPQAVTDAFARTADSASTQAAMASPQLALAGQAAAPAAAAMLAVPVLLSPLQAPPTPRTPRQQAVEPERGWHQRGGNRDADHDTPQDNEAEAAALPDITADDEPTPPTPSHDTDTAALLALLESHASADVQRELRGGRRVLLVLPQAHAGSGLVAARAALLSTTTSRRFAACRWWPGSADAAAPEEGPWPQWRVFREGDPLHAPVLVSRAAGSRCRVLLGSPAPRLLDSQAALLELPERLRFMQALGGQWSMLVVAAPAGVAP